MWMSLVIAWTGAWTTMARAEDVECTSEYKEWATLQQTTPRPSDFTDQNKQKLDSIKRCELRRSASIADCGSAQTNFKKTIEQFQHDCSEAGLPTSRDAGAIACSTQADPLSTDRGRKACACASKTAQQNNVEACAGFTEKDYQQCPQTSDAAADRLQKQIERAEDQVNKLREKGEKADEATDKSDDKAAEKVSQARKDKAKAVETYNNAVAEATNAKSDAEAQMMSTLNGMQEKIFAVNTKLTESRQADAQAYSNMLKQKMEIELGCATQATAAVNAAATEAVTHIRDGTYNRGSQNDIFRQVGLNDRQSWQRQATIKKKWCMDSEATHSTQKSAEMAYQDTLRAQAASRQSGYDEIAMIRSQMAQVQSPNNCAARTAAGAATRTQDCKDEDKLRAKIAAAATARDAARKEADADVRDAQAAASKAAIAKMGKTDKTEAELRDAETNLKALKEAQQAQARYPYAGPREPAAKKLATTGMQLFDQAGRVNYCCVAKPNSVETGVCNQSKNYLATQGVEVSGLNRVSEPSYVPSRTGN